MAALTAKLTADGNTTGQVWNGRAMIEDVLEKLPRWRHHGRLVTEARTELSHLREK